jgi:sulfate adenylyltransferase
VAETTCSHAIARLIRSSAQPLPNPWAVQGSNDYRLTKLLAASRSRLGMRTGCRLFGLAFTADSVDLQSTAANRTPGAYEMTAQQREAAHVDDGHGAFATSAHWTPPPATLDNLEMLLLGAYRPLTGFLGQREAALVAAERRLEDGTPWPLPVVLEVPPDIAAIASATGTLRLTDEEGAPVGEVSVTEVWTVPGGGRAVAGQVRPLSTVSRGAYPSLRRTVADFEGSHDRPLLAVPLTHAPDHGFLSAVRSRAADLDADVMLMPLVGAGRSSDLDAPALVRAAGSVRDLLGPGVRVLPIPLPGCGDDDDRALPYIAAAYGATHVVGPVAITPPGLAASVVSLELSDSSARATFPPAVERELRRSGRIGTARPAGVAVLFTGLSGSGKSTLARALREALLERTDRTVSMLDGDIVRRMLSSELGFSRSHRELNVRRIGYVAAEVARHGGIAICAPIAPYTSTRHEFRSMVESVGQLLLVYVSTPLEVCESRDRKGLYARARAGLIAEFTGISDPYEAPTDADLCIDTSRISVDDAVTQILATLSQRDLIRPEDEVRGWT